MIGKEILKISLDLMFETETEYEKNAVSFINLMIPELFETENLIRSSLDQETLKEVPYINDLEDVIPYCDNLTKGAMPYGLASMIMMDDDDTSKAGYYRQLYVNAVNSYSRSVPGLVVDTYE